MRCIISDWVKWGGGELHTKSVVFNPFSKKCTEMLFWEGGKVAVYHLNLFSPENLIQKFLKRKQSIYKYSLNKILVPLPNRMYILQDLNTVPKMLSRHRLPSAARMLSLVTVHSWPVPKVYIYFYQTDLLMTIKQHKTYYESIQKIMDHTKDRCKYF